MKRNVIIAFFAASACSAPDTTTIETCDAGTRFCVCTDEDLCGRGLTCDQGYCIAPGDVMPASQSAGDEVSDSDDNVAGETSATSPGDGIAAGDDISDSDDSVASGETSGASSGGGNASSDSGDAVDSSDTDAEPIVCTDKLAAFYAGCRSLAYYSVVGPDSGFAEQLELLQLENALCANGCPDSESGNLCSLYARTTCTLECSEVYAEGINATNDVRQVALDLAYLECDNEYAECMKTADNPWTPWDEYNECVAECAPCLIRAQHSCLEEAYCSGLQGTELSEALTLCTDAHNGCEDDRVVCTRLCLEAAT